MQSSTYGCPASPKSGPTGISVLSGFLDANFGLTSEDNGVRARARAIIHRK